ncbi:MAG: DUF6175 family protein [Bacteroidales bacterium]|nr:DUF6175 family protein [Bacteroidales bacterium]
MTRKIFTLGVAALCAFAALAQQAKQPTIMVRPDDAWMTNNNYMKAIDNDGYTELDPQYELALRTHETLAQVLADVSSLMADRGMPVVSMSETIKRTKARSAERAAVTSKSTGAKAAVSTWTQLNNAAKADIIFDIGWVPNTRGARSCVDYRISALDAYTMKSVASKTGTTEWEMASTPALQVKEAVLANMEYFLDQLQSHFDDLRNNGREVSLELGVFDDGSGIDFETEYGGKELREIVEDWVSDNSVRRNYHKDEDTEDWMVFGSVRIPLYDVRERPQDAGTWARGLRDHLKGMGIPTKLVSNHLGSATIYLGEK